MSDFTFLNPLTGILRFNDGNVLLIGFDSDTEDISITKLDDETGQSKTLDTNLNGGGGGGAVLGSKTITENGTYDAIDDDLDGYDQVTVNVRNTIDLKNDYTWEVGAVEGRTGHTYSSDKSTNTARLRTASMISLPNKSCTFSMNWDVYQAQYKPYTAAANGASDFIVMTQDTVISPTYPYIAIVLRYRDGSTAMSLDDVDAINPILIIE